GQRLPFSSALNAAGDVVRYGDLIKEGADGPRRLVLLLARAPLDPEEEGAMKAVKAAVEEALAPTDLLRVQLVFDFPGVPSEANKRTAGEAALAWGDGVLWSSPREATLGRVRPEPDAAVVALDATLVVTALVPIGEGDEGLEERLKRELG